MTTLTHKFLIYVFVSALRVSSLLLAHFQMQVYKFGSGPSLLGMVSAPGQIMKLLIMKSSPLPCYLLLTEYKHLTTCIWIGYHIIWISQYCNLCNPATQRLIQKDRHP
jgi:hypothetical protein